MKKPLVIWCNTQLNTAATSLLEESVAPHRLLFSAPVSNLAAGAFDPLLDGCDVAFGQPDPEQVIKSSVLKWTHISSAGYTRYDRPVVRAALSARNAIMTNSSSVYDEPCAEHIVAFMYAQARQFPVAWADQAGPRLWPAKPLRASSRLLVGQSVLVLGYGAIARRIIELLAPLSMHIAAVRQKVRGDETVPTHAISELDELLPRFDHVINALPASESTNGIITAKRFGLMKATAIFYNIGRGTTIDQEGLLEALKSDHLGAAYLDVVDPEPLPQDHPLWSAPRCFVTPHVGGGHHNEFERLAEHFVANLRRFETGQHLLDRVM